MKSKKIIIRKISVSALINVLLKFEENNKFYVDLLCTINKEGKQNKIKFKVHKKNRQLVLKEKILTPELLQALLKNN